MKNLTKLSLGLAAAFMMSCGDDKAAPDAPKPIDAAIDAGPDAFMPPAAPTLGAQIDRMARPAVNTALVAPLETNATLKTAKKDKYNQASNPMTWATTNLDAAVPTNVIVREFANNIAVFDVLDKGLGTVPDPDGCGNAALYTGPAGPNSYINLAGVLADDELYLDTTKGSCAIYLSLEVEVAAGVPHTQCGGRTLTMDVVDFSYSLLAAGVSGFDPANNFAPRVGDGVAPHTDVNNDNFPFLGAPH